MKKEDKLLQKADETGIETGERKAEKREEHRAWLPAQSGPCGLALRLPGPDTCWLCLEVGEGASPGTPLQGAGQPKSKSPFLGVLSARLRRAPRPYACMCMHVRVCVCPAPPVGTRIHAGCVPMRPHPHVPPLPWSPGTCEPAVPSRRPSLRLAPLSILALRMWFRDLLLTPHPIGFLSRPSLPCVCVGCGQGTKTQGVSRSREAWGASMGGAPSGASSTCNPPVALLTI